MWTNCSVSFKDCTARRNLKERASAWPRCNALCKSMEAGFGLRGNWIRVPLSISPSAPENTANLRTLELRLEAAYERRRSGHTVGGRQSGRRGPYRARFAARETGEQHRRGTRWRGSSGFSLLPWSVEAKIV